MSATPKSTQTTQSAQAQKASGGGLRQKGQIALIAGVVLLVIGGVLITLGWDGAAELDYVQGQFPYLLSASLPGIAVIIIGVTVLVLAVVRRDAAEREEQLDKLQASVAELARLLGPADPFDPAMTGEYRPRPRSRVAASNGVDGDAETSELPKLGTFEQGQ